MPNALRGAGKKPYSSEIGLPELGKACQSLTAEKLELDDASGDRNKKTCLSHMLHARYSNPRHGFLSHRCTAVSFHTIVPAIVRGVRLQLETVSSPRLLRQGTDEATAAFAVFRCRF
jgi:hypothetical protein